MECGETPLGRQRLAGSYDNLIGRDIVGALFDATAAKEAFGHGQVSLVVKGNVSFHQVLAECHLPPRYGWFTLQLLKSRAVSTTCPAFDTLLQFLFDSFKSICVLVFISQLNTY